MEQSRPTVLAENALHIAARECDAGVAAHQIGRRLGELEIWECRRDAERRGTLVLAFCAVADPELEGFVCRSCELDFAALAARLHSHVDLDLATWVWLWGEDDVG